MKTKLLTIVLLAFAGMAWGQEKEKIKSKMVFVDPFGEDVIPNKLKKGDYVKFQISNVNTLKVRGYTTAQGTNITYDVPQSVINLLKADTAEPNDSLSFVSDAAEVSFKNAYKLFITKYATLLQYQNLENRLQSHFGNTVFIKNTSVVKENAKGDYHSLYKALDNIGAKNQVKKSIQEIQKLYTELSELYNTLNKNAATTTISGSFKSTDGTVKIDLKDATVKTTTTNKFETEFEYAKKTIETVNSKADSITHKAFAGIDLYYLICKEDFKITTDAQQLTKDVVTITPELKSEDGKVKHTLNPYTFYTGGHMKVDFSTGYLMSFIGNENYNTFTNTTGNTEISKSNSDKITHALGVLMHVYWQNSNLNLPNLGFSAGASISEDTKIGFYGGGSVFFLEKNRLVFTAGLSFVKIKELNTANLTTKTDSKNYLFTNTNDTEIRYNEIYKPAFFMGVTFNIFNSEN